MLSLSCGLHYFSNVHENVPSLKRDEATKSTTGRENQVKGQKLGREMGGRLGGKKADLEKDVRGQKVRL